MSNKNPPCSNTYFNYASYMSTRNCEQQICKIVSDIENGTILPHFLANGGTINGDVTITESLTIYGTLQVDGPFTYNGETTFSDVKCDTVELRGDDQRLTINTDGMSSPILEVVALPAGTLSDPAVVGSDVCGTISYSQWDTNKILQVQLSGTYTSVPLVFLTGMLEGTSIKLLDVINSANTVHFYLMSDTDITNGSIQYIVVDQG